MSKAAIGEVQTDLSRWRLPPEKSSTKITLIMNDGRTRQGVSTSREGMLRFSDKLGFVKLFGKYCFARSERSGGLQPKYRDLWFRFVDAVIGMTRAETSQADAQKLQVEVKKLLSDMEKQLPPTELTIMTHKLGHIPEQIQQCGPAHNLW